MLSPEAFVTKWKQIALNENASAQTHFNELCQLLGVPQPLDADPTGEWYTFEKKLTKHTGAPGRADVWRRGSFAWEYKGPGKDLDKAYTQLLQYREALENPPLLVVSDMTTIQAHTNFTNSVKRVVT